MATGCQGKLFEKCFWAEQLQSIYQWLTFNHLSKQVCPSRRKLKSKRRYTLNYHLTRKTFQIILSNLGSVDFLGLKKKIWNQSYILKVPKFPPPNSISISSTYMINGTGCYSQISPWRSGHYLVWVHKSQYHHRRKKVIIYLTCHCLPPNLVHIHSA